jgi:hypothetical protein
MKGHGFVDKILTDLGFKDHRLKIKFKIVQKTTDLGFKDHMLKNKFKIVEKTTDLKLKAKAKKVRDAVLKLREKFNM